jgi:uncharacterized protein
LADAPLTAARDGLYVAIRLSPRAKADRVLAIAAAAEGKQVVKACVTAAAEAGRANEALLRLLARAGRLPRRDPAILAGAASRQKDGADRRRPAAAPRPARRVGPIPA